MITDTDNAVLKKTTKTPITPELMEFFGYIRRVNHNFNRFGCIHYQDPLRSYIRFSEIDATTSNSLIDLLSKKHQRYCYIVRLEIQTISSALTYIIYTVQDLKRFQKVLEDIEAFEAEVRKQTYEIVEHIKDLKY